MSSTTIAVGEHIFDMTYRNVKFTGYGVDLDALLAGQIPPPPEGARLDAAFEGVLGGPKLKGTISGTDYAHVRADGRIQLHMHAEITTEDGAKIAFFADGVANPEEGTGNLQERYNITLTTSSPAYSWVNQLQVWAQGTVDMTKNEADVKGYAA